ncbi:MAG: ABC transporter [Chloroflexi bacterium]|nr:ABC transporter [Chloroflexota bacterium]|tara:strand:+ start:127 stop:900 length:774 start_codon:yes stop_codon:yes gene_type:complete
MGLQLKDISLSYKENLVLSNINIEFDVGEVIGLVGRNGSGKTSLINIMNGLVRPTSGLVLYNGKDINNISIKERAKFISVVPQRINFPADYKVLDLVYMGRNPHMDFFHRATKEDLNNTYEVMKTTNIVGLAHKLISEISGGEMQRVAIAMALNQRAPVLLLDEPTTNLDLVHEVLVLELVKKLNSYPKSCVILSIHDLTLASKYCDKVVMLKNGELFAKGNPKDVFSKENIESVFSTKVRVNKDPIDNSTLITPEV